MKKAGKQNNPNIWIILFFCFLHNVGFRSIFTFIYIYIYMCVCVCVCAYVWVAVWMVVSKAKTT